MKDLSADNNGSVGFCGVKWGGGLVVRRVEERFRGGL